MILAKEKQYLVFRRCERHLRPQPKQPLVLTLVQQDNFPVLSKLLLTLLQSQLHLSIFLSQILIHRINVLQMIEWLLPLLSKHFCVRHVIRMKELAELNFAKVVIRESGWVLEEQLLVAVGQTSNAVFVKVAQLFFIVVTGDSLI